MRRLLLCLHVRNSQAQQVTRSCCVAGNLRPFTPGATFGGVLLRLGVRRRRAWCSRLREDLCTWARLRATRRVLMRPPPCSPSFRWGTSRLWPGPSCARCRQPGLRRARWLRWQGLRWDAPICSLRACCTSRQLRLLPHRARALTPLGTCTPGSGAMRPRPARYAMRPGGQPASSRGGIQGRNCTRAQRSARHFHCSHTRGAGSSSERGGHFRLAHAPSLDRA